MSKLELDSNEIKALKYTVDRAGGYLDLSTAATKVLAFLESQEQVTPKPRRMQSNPRADNSSRPHHEHTEGPDYAEQEKESSMSYLECWAALDQIMVEAGMDKNLEPEQAQAWLMSKLQATPKRRRMQGNPKSIGDGLVSFGHHVEHNENHACGLLKCIPVATPELSKRPLAYDGIEFFACWLLDHCEGETITEELLMPWAQKAWDEYKKRTEELFMPWAPKEWDKYNKREDGK